MPLLVLPVLALGAASLTIDLVGMALKKYSEYLVDKDIAKRKRQDKLNQLEEETDTETP